VVQEESLAQRLDLFFGELIETANKESREQMLIAALTFRNPVAVVQGTTNPDDRLNRFMGFNSPLLPEILVCTSVGQEGINLHRFCRQVIHYDLPFNPASLEQRTGRIDRIGCKAFRDRAKRGDKVFLEVVVPYLAGTYDERIYEAMRTRAQTFEVLTGGDLASDLPVDQDVTDSEGKDSKSPESALVQIPEQVIKDLRVTLSVAPKCDNAKAPQVE
jgi:superfamily II DNA/RNA helicase